MRWLIVLPFDRPGHMGVDFAEELTALGHEVRTFAYRRDNALYKSTGSKTLYQSYALRSLRQAGLRNLHFLPMYCVPALHHRVTLTDAERARYGTPLSFVGSRYPYRERFVRELSSYPLKLWGGGWARARAPEIRAMVAGGPVWGRDKLCVYSGSTLSLNQHHPMNDVVGVNTRTFELAAAGACQVVDFKEDLATLFKPGEELVVYRDLTELRRQLDYHLAHPDEAAGLGANARRRALAEHTLRHRIEEIVAAVEERCRPS